jgi:integrase
MGVKVREKPAGSGIWWVFINHNGLRRSKKIGQGVKAKATALDVARKVEAKLALKEFNLAPPEPEEKPRIPTFGEYAKTWIEVTIPATCAPSTARDYRGLLENHILPGFDRYPVTEINRLMVKKFLMHKLTSGLAPVTVTHIKNAISGSLNLAVDDEMIPANPAQRLGKVIRSRGLQLESDPLTREELSLLLEAFREHYPRHYPLALTLARTGMRIGEALGLQWGDIDFNGRFILIRRTYSKCHEGKTKTGKQRRVDMSKQLSDELRDLRNQRRLETLKNGWKEVPPWVFLTAAGTPMDTDSWRKRVFESALSKAGLRRIRVHDLRHTYASLLIQAGESLAYVRDQLGHHSIKVTVDIYGHLAPEGRKEAVDRLDDAPVRTPGAPANEKGASHVG